MDVALPVAMMCIRAFSSFVFVTLLACGGAPLSVEQTAAEPEEVETPVHVAAASPPEREAEPVVEGPVEERIAEERIVEEHIEAQVAPTVVLYDDEDIRVTRTDDQCTVEWGDAQLTHYFHNLEVSRHRLAPGVDVLHFAGGGAHAVVHAGCHAGSSERNFGAAGER